MWKIKILPIFLWLNHQIWVVFSKKIFFIIQVPYVHVINRITITRRTRNIMWTLSSAIGFFSMFSVTLFYIPSYNYSQLESALYNSLHRLGWSIFTGWLVLGCVTSEGNGLKTFLSSQILVPISRLTYCAYLTNGFIELYMAGSIRTPKYMSVSSLVSSFVANFQCQNYSLCH